MAYAATSPGERRFGETARRDAWWLQPLAVFLGLATLLVYTTWASLQGDHYFFGPYLSPFYSHTSCASQTVKDALKQYKGVYFGAIGGAGAVLSQFIKKVEIVAYEDLGTEAIRRLEVENFPAIVINDCHGGDLYQEGMARYAR